MVTNRVSQVLALRQQLKDASKYDSGSLVIQSVVGFDPSSVQVRVRHPVDVYLIWCLLFGTLPLLFHLGSPTGFKQASENVRQGT